MEDAHKLGILSTEKTEELLLSFYSETADSDYFQYKERIYQEVTDTNERIAFLRATTINKLVRAVSQVFIEQEDKIMAGQFTGSLVDYVDPTLTLALNICRNVSVKQIYNHPAVVKKIELTGFHVLGTLMLEFSQAVLSPEKNYHRKLKSLLPEQFKPKKR